MSAGFALLAGGAAADDIVASMQSLEVEENADSPGAFSLTLPLSAVDGELDWVGDPRLAPMARIAVVARGEEGPEECVFDGYVLSHSASIDPGLVDSRLRVWGQDASWLMNLTERTKEWVDISDANAAASIFSDYGITPGPHNNADDSPLHAEAGHSLMQRGTDAQFLLALARRSGKLFRVASTTAPDRRVGIFARPRLDGTPTVSMTVTDIATANVSDVEVAWDVMRASTARAGQALLSASEAASAEESDSGLRLLDARSLADFRGQSAETLVAAAVDDPGELTLRAQAALIESGFFVRCTGKADVGSLGKVLRVGSLVSLEMAGSLHSGAYYVWSVRHSIAPDRHEMRFELIRNAVGSAPSGGGGLLGALGL
jgi:phage protein D